MEWLNDNWADIATIVAAIHVLALAIVNVTPTPKDNEWVSRVYGWIEIFGGLITTRAKEKKDDPIENE